MKWPNSPTDRRAMRSCAACVACPRSRSSGQRQPRFLVPHRQPWQRSACCLVRQQFQRRVQAGVSGADHAWPALPLLLVPEEAVHALTQRLRDHTVLFRRPARRVLSCLLQGCPDVHPVPGRQHCDLWHWFRCALHPVCFVPGCRSGAAVLAAHQSGRPALRLQLASLGIVQAPLRTARVGGKFDLHQHRAPGSPPDWSSSFNFPRSSP